MNSPCGGFLLSNASRGGKLEILAAAGRLSDLRVPPGNRLEALKGDRHGQHSIRINDQWRICFRWDDGAHDVRSSIITEGYGP
jgi:proteic killer suppression protein